MRAPERLGTWNRISILAGSGCFSKGEGYLIFSILAFDYYCLSQQMRWRKTLRTSIVVETAMYVK
jgi:hypothetical protein